MQGDLLLIAAGDAPTVNKALNRVRLYLIETLSEAPQQQHAITWVTDFPMFEWNEEEGRLEALHHPFTAPRDEDAHVR